MIPSSFDFQQFHTTLLEEARVGFHSIQQQHIGETFYCFALYTCGERGYIFPTASTEEGLTQVARKYMAVGDNNGRTLEQLRLELRWSPCDSPLHSEGEAYCRRANEMLEPVPELLQALYEREHNSWEQSDKLIEQLDSIFIDVLKQLDAEGVFGRGEHRESVVVNLLMGDQSDESRLAYAKQLNPREAYQKLEQDLSSTG